VGRRDPLAQQRLAGRRPQGRRTAYAMTNLQERGCCSSSPTTEVYEGMIVGENSRADDMDVNITKEKKQTNVGPPPPTTSRS
jgi:predicted membrane GTPase involved in stress response